MVPHIVFHPQPVDYRPGPELWRSDACDGAPDVATSGITQPPVLATAVRILHEAAPDRAFLEEVLPALEAWHRWFHRERAVDGSGLVAILHPWESGGQRAALRRGARARRRDGSPSRARIGAASLRTSGRPTATTFATSRSSPVCVPAATGPRRSRRRRLPTSTSRSTRSSRWPRAISRGSGELGEIGSRVAAGRAARPCRVVRRGTSRRGRIASTTCTGTAGGAQTVADVSRSTAAARRTARAACWTSTWAPERLGPAPDAPWAVTTVEKSNHAYDHRRYWRGPVWVNMNWFLIRGLERAGLLQEARELRELTLRLVRAAGFSEYYEPDTGAPLGSGEFSWSAALTLDLLATPAA